MGSRRVGFFGCLHTWGRDPSTYHPHVYFVVPGGGLCDNNDAWLSTPENFLFPHAVACRVYRAKMRDAFEALGWKDDVDTSAWKQNWVVDIQPAGDGTSAVKYLAPYVHRVAISDKRIVSVRDTEVVYRVSPSGKQNSVVRRTSGPAFVGSFLQHVLPPGFQKIRYYGWMSPNSRVSVSEVRWMAMIALGIVFCLDAWSPIEPERLDQPMICRHCGGQMQRVRQVDGDCQHLIEHGREYLNSG
ncbi:MAG: transposase [Planctomycetota bacterium]